MSQHTAELTWERDGAPYSGKSYSRRHTVRFDGGLVVPAAASPTIVPEPLTDAAAMDPEEAFVAAIASCHLLWFLAVAAERGYCVDRYRDSPAGTLSPDSKGRLAMTEVVLRPSALFSGDRRPTAEELGQLHTAAHERCFISNSVRTVVRIAPRSNDEDRPGTKDPE